MNFKKILFGVASLGLLASCQNDGNEPTPGPSFKGDGYIAVNIKLPTNAQTRALNDDFDDGEIEEYTVKDAVLLLFTGASEEVAKFHSAHAITDFNKVDDDTEKPADNITTSYLKTFNVTKVELSEYEELYGIVMLNFKNVLDLASDNTITLHTSNNGDVHFIAGTDYKTLLKAEFNGNDLFTNDPVTSKKDYFFMTNSPLSANAGGLNSPAPTKAGDIFTLVPLKNGIKTTEAEARENPSGRFYVERAVAKATLDVSATAVVLNQGDNDASNDITLTIENFGWVLENIEPTSYVVRRLGDNDSDFYNLFKTWAPYKSVQSGLLYDPIKDEKGYRLVGEAPMGVTSVQPVHYLYRPYWCYDPHYATDLHAESEAATWTAPTDFKGKDAIFYCNENTFNVDKMSYNNTTRAILKTTLTINGKDKGSNIYTVNGNETELFTSEAAATKVARNYIYNSSEVKKALTDAQNPTTNGDKVSPKLSDDELDKLITIKFDRQSDGYLKATSITFNDPKTITFADGNVSFGKTPSFLGANDEEDLLATINKNYKFAEYIGGVSYYDIRFKHFGDELTPWNGTGKVTADAYKSSDPERDFLGRYGMVRNNWYDVNVKAIKHLGTPEPTNITINRTSDDDDEQEKWVSVVINVLSWAKRVQNWDL